MVPLGVTLVALGLLSVLLEPKWLPGYVRRGLPHAGYLVLGWTAIGDRVTIGHIEGQLATTPDSSLRAIAPVLQEITPRTLVSLLPPRFVGAPSTLSVALEAALAVAVGVTVIALTRPEWLRPVSRTVERVGAALALLLVAWTTGIHSRTLSAIRDRLQIDANAPLRSIADLIAAIPGEYKRVVLTLLLLSAAVLYVLGLRHLPRFSRVGNAA
jgi:hypothetical protein